MWSIACTGWCALCPDATHAGALTARFLGGYVPFRAMCPVVPWVPRPLMTHPQRSSLRRLLTVSKDFCFYQVLWLCQRRERGLVCVNHAVGQKDGSSNVELTRRQSSRGEGFLSADHVWTQTAALPWVSSLQARPADSGLSKPPQLHEPISFFVIIGI